jgi:hypothetical protein
MPKPIVTKLGRYVMPSEAISMAHLIPWSHQYYQNYCLSNCWGSTLNARSACHEASHVYHSIWGPLIGVLHKTIPSVIPTLKLHKFCCYIYWSNYTYTEVFFLLVSKLIFYWKDSRRLILPRTSFIRAWFYYPEVGASSIYWDQLRRYFTWGRRQSGLRNVVLIKNRTTNNVQKVSNCINIPSTRISISYYNRGFRYCNLQ